MACTTLLVKVRELRIASACVLCACLWLYGMLACPQTAFAWLYDVTDAYPASQAITITGDVLTAADIPEGNYSSTISCSSSMCKFTNVTVTSVGGELWVTFKLSSAYDALFFGTAEEAAACSDDQGDNYSPYYTSGSVGERADRQFSLPIPALNYEVTLATFSGGSQGTDKGLWYTRTIVCNSSAEIDLAVETGRSPGSSDDEGEGAEPDDSGEQGDSGTTDDPGEQGDSGTTDDPGEQGDSGTTDDPGEQGDSGTTDDPGDDEDTGKSSNSSKSGSKNGKRSNSNTPSVTTPADSGDDSGQGSQDEEAAASGKKKKAKSDGKTAIPINFVSTDLALDFETKSTAEVDQAEVEGAANRKAAMVGGIALLDLVLAGAFLVGLRHTRPRRFPRV